MADKPKLTLGYWKGYGKAQPGRYLLELTETPYNDVQYVEDDDWFVRDKFSLGLDFPNLPYLIDGDVKLTEFSAISSYLVDTYGKPEWLGKGQDKYVVESLRSLLADVLSGIYRTGLQPKEKQDEYLDSEVLQKFRYIQKFLGNKEYLVGYFTIADLYFLTALNYFKFTFAPTKYAEFALAFDPLHLRLHQIPQIAAYIASDRHPSS